MAGVLRVSVDFQWRYKLNGKTRQVRIGSWPKLSLKAIRDERDRLAVEVKTGTDPVQRKATEKLKIEVDQVEAHNRQLDRLEVIAEQQARLTVRQLFKLWRDLALKQRGDGGAEAQRAFERDVFPLIGDLAVADVKKVHVQNIVDTMMARDVVRMTKRVLSDLRQMFGFALDRDYVEADPTARIKKAKSRVKRHGAFRAAGTTPPLKRPTWRWTPKPSPSRWPTGSASQAARLRAARS